MMFSSLKINQLNLNKNLSVIYKIPRKIWIVLGIQFIFIGLLSEVAVIYVSADEWWVNGVWCALGGILIIRALKKAFSVGIFILLCDHMVMLTIAFFVYFIAGASLLSFGPIEQIESSISYYSISAADAMRVNGSNAIGFGVMLLVASKSGTAWIGRATKKLSTRASSIPIFPAIIFFLIIGLIAIGNTLIADLEIANNDVVSGVWRSLSKFTYVAIFLGASYSGRGDYSLKLIVFVIAIVLSALGLLLFNKTDFLLPIGALVIGLSIRYSSIKIMIYGVFFMLFLFSYIGSIVSYSRNTLTNESSGLIVNRINAIVDGSQSDSRQSVKGEYHPWARFCYTPPLTAGMDLYDRGRGGEDFELMPWLFVPRFLAPNKPIISQSGADLHTKVTGQTGSSTGLGVFVSGYYNAGWLGLLVTSALCGWILAQTSRVALEIISRNSLVLFPFAFLGVYMAFRIDGHFIVDYLGVFIFILYPLLLVSIFMSGRR